MFDRRLPRPLILPFLLLLALSPACIKSRKTPNLARIFSPAREFVGKTPIIIIPGALGSQLVDTASGRVVWPSADRSKEDDIDLPTSPDLASNRDGLAATKIVDATKLSLLLPEVRVYRDLLRTLTEAAGYRPGSFDTPPSDGAADTYYVFSYDWRRDNVENARLLARRIAALKAALGRPDLKFNIIAHSMGGLIARYYAMYGDRDIGEGGPDWSGGENISRLVLVGTPNRGAMDALRSLVEGYNFYGGDVKRRTFFNKLDAEMIFSLPSTYQLLPFSRGEQYVTAGLRFAALDLYDPETWRKYGWSIYAPKYRERIEKRHKREAAKILREQEIFLATVLERASAFHDALSRDGLGDRPFRVFLFGGDCEPTLRAPLVVEAKDGFKTYFRATRVRVGRLVIDRDLLFEKMYAPGDGRVTRSSLLAESDSPTNGSLFASAIGIDYAVFQCELHGDLPNDDELQNNILSILVTDTDGHTMHTQEDE
jgi:pimeloyl-ACP methyl ester carboxylesterase